MPDLSEHVHPAAEPITLTVCHLPADVASEVRQAQVEDPELIRRMLVYGITHRTIFRTLLAHHWGL